MRRHSKGVLNRDELVVAQIASLEREDPERVIRLLEPLVGEPRKARIWDVIEKRLGSVTVAFESPHDPHNGAAVIRSCEAFGVQSLHVLEQWEPFLSASTVSRGAEKWIDIVAHPNIEAGVTAIRAAGYELVATHPDGGLAPEDLASIPRVCVVLGNERDGIAPAMMDACSRSVRVPMRGFVESLNVSVTAAILLSAATRNRPGDLTDRERRRLYARGLYFSAPRADDHLFG